jgi:integrase
MPKRNLNDRVIDTLKPAPAGKIIDTWDAHFPSFGVRVSHSGRKTFVLAARYPGDLSSTRAKLGNYISSSAQGKPQAQPLSDQEAVLLSGPLMLAQARQKAGAWLRLIERGIDPREEMDRQREAEAKRRKNTFAAIVDDFIAEKLTEERKGQEVATDIRRDFIPAWGMRPVTDITDLDILAIVKAKKRTAPAQARNLLGIAKRLFGWVVDQRCYGLTVSPAKDLKATKIIGKKLSGHRILNGQEVFALWRAAERTPYPYGPVYQLLVLTALRLNEAADASWPELDLINRTWTIPASRMKGRNEDARPHAVPLTDEVMAILKKLPRFKTGNFLFSTNYGRSPAWMSDKIKKKIDARMLRTMRALARRQGDDPREVALLPWTNHDIRRTVRSNLSKLRVTEEAREAVLAHARPGIKGVYDRYDYLDEKREALELWAGRLRDIVTPPPANFGRDGVSEGLGHDERTGQADRERVPVGGDRLQVARGYASERD